MSVRDTLETVGSSRDSDSDSDRDRDRGGHVASRLPLEYVQHVARCVCVRVCATNALANIFKNSAHDLIKCNAQGQRRRRRQRRRQRSPHASIDPLRQRLIRLPCQEGQAGTGGCWGSLVSGRRSSQVHVKVAALLHFARDKRRRGEGGEVHPAASFSRATSRRGSRREYGGEVGCIRGIQALLKWRRHCLVYLHVTSKCHSHAPLDGS